MDPQEILDKAREAIKDYAGDDQDKLFYANRFVFARLQLDERKTKTNVKKVLLEEDKPCYYCNKHIEDKSGVHLHRMDGERAYSLENCVLMHPECHKKYHTENPTNKKSGRPSKKIEEEYKAPILEKESKRYDNNTFTYWWDISPGFIEKIDRYEAIEFIKSDNGERSYVPTAALKGYLTNERQTSRGKGNWGIKVLKGREGELAFEPGRKSDKWLFLPVIWLNETKED